MPDDWMVVWRTSDIYSDLHGQVVGTDGTLEENSALVTSSGWQTVPALAGGQADGYHLLAWQDSRSGNADVYSNLMQWQSSGAQLQATTIVYDYDPLYRLTETVYTGSITATYSYVYDAVGNMTAYTDTVGVQTVVFTRTFNGANQLISSQSSDSPTADNFSYDDNGNLTLSTAGNFDTFSYNQRNLLTQVWRMIGMEESEVTDYVYDGDGNRLQQQVSQLLTGGSQSFTITYTIDIVGLSQVLVADDGITTTHNLFGLDLIHQDDGAATRTLLADGLGSVRTEMVGNAVETVTTYEPYGNLLAQTGTSGTVYGFTGEQHDASTGLQYLRARYYNPYLNQWLSKDPFAGYATLPQFQNGYSYANNNPVNAVDPTGNIPIEPGNNNYTGYDVPCPVGGWDCEAVHSITNLKHHFLDSANRHNKIPGMDDNGFAALIASTIVSERRVGRIDESDPIRNRTFQFLEDLAVDLGCIVSGHYLNEAREAGDYVQLWRYFTNQDIPAYPTVGIGNVHLDTAANLWKGQAVSSLGDVTEVSVTPLKVTNIFGVEVGINNPFAPQIAYCSGDVCPSYEPSEIESYQIIAHQLRSDSINIEYVAANLEAGALRMLAKGLTPTAFNSATWHLKGVQTEDEFEQLGWNPGGATYILNEIPTALQVLGLTSNWNGK